MRSKYVFAGHFVGGYLFGCKFHEKRATVAINLHETSEMLVSIDEDDDPLLDDVRIKRVLFVVNESFLQAPKALESQVLELVLNVDEFFEEDEELAIPLGLKVLESLHNMLDKHHYHFFIVEAQIAEKF